MTQRERVQSQPRCKKTGDKLPSVGTESEKGFVGARRGVLQCLKVSEEMPDLPLQCCRSSALRSAFPWPEEAGGYVLWVRHSPAGLGAVEGTETLLCVGGECLGISRTCSKLD